MNKQMVRVENLSFSYKNHNENARVLNDINLRLERGGILSIIGPSGCGKTTLLYNIAGLRKAGSGSIYINDYLVNRPREKTGIIFQHFGLLPWKTALENATLGLKIRGVSDNDKQKTVLSIMKHLDIIHLSEKYPRHLSGGEKQRFAIARALVMKPDLLLLDEPFSSLDALTRESLQEALLHIWKEWQLTIILVTHDIEEAVFVGTEIIVLDKSGTIVQHKILVDEKENDFRNSPVFHETTAALRECMRRVINEDHV